jgi:hypothetical protein
MKTIITTSIALLFAFAISAQCITGFNQTFSGTTGTFQAYFIADGDTLTNSAEVEFIWQVNEAILSGEVITVDFLEDIYYTVCVSGSGLGCTSTACDTVYFPSGTLNDSCNMFLSYDIIPASSPNINDGAIDITVQGGSAPYAYYWDNYETTEDIDGLSPGTYTVNVQDDNLCQLTHSFVVTAYNDSTNNDTTVVDYLWVGAYYYFETDDDCTATVYAETYGGTPPYTYSWSNDVLTNLFTGACGNDFYCVTITDSEGLNAEGCVFVDYFNGQDSTWYVNDSLETIVDTCLDEIIAGEIIDYYIDGNNIIVIWEFIDSQDNQTILTISYPVEDSVAEGFYDIYLFVNCDNAKSMTTYSDRIEITPEQLNGIAEYFDKTTFNIYPNPVSDQLNIEMISNNYDDANLTIINATGQIVYTKNISINDGANLFKFSVENLVSGMYFVKISGVGNYETLRFIK